jgi:alkylation response protein AidB-like acyl-CoA dehydrogenase
VDLQLSTAERAWQERAREFADRWIRPLDHRREWAPEGAARRPWELIEAASRAGFRTCTVPPEFGGPEPPMSFLAEALVMEEFAAADPGIAFVFNHAMKDVRQIERLATPEQKRWFYPEYVRDHRYLMASAGSEPEHGADWLLPYADFHFDTAAVLEGDQWVLNGRKHCITNGAEAKLILIFAATDPSRPFAEGTSLFMVPRSAPGLRAGVIHDKLGLRFANNAEVVMEDCRIGRDMLLGGLHQGIRQRQGYVGENSLVSLGIKLGCARAAVETATNWARRRVQGGKPIIEHQAVGLKLAEAATLVEAMRSMCYRVAAAMADPQTYDARLNAMATWFGAEAAVRAALLAFEVCGCHGAWLDHQAQKHLRDALMFLPNDGTHTIHLLRVQRMLAELPAE